MALFFTHNGKAQRAGKRGVGFAPFAKPTTLLTVRLEQFVGRARLQDELHFYPRTIKHTIHPTDYFDISCGFASAMHVAQTKTGNANIARLSLKYLVFFFSGCFSDLSIGTFLDANFTLHAVSTGTALLGRKPLGKTFQVFSFSKPRRLLLDFSFLKTC
ncbi:MAG TPA: hypothetical protein ENJ28_09800 [Gammaproteobacteria bacterium]|nr:hypothetical protein [Gammaproteobacteria bacterium]